MSSKYLNGLSGIERNNLEKKLAAMQSDTCYICQEPIDLNLHSVNIDHIIPLALHGLDKEDNFALTHESCNKSKLDSHLEVARRLCVLKKIVEMCKMQGKQADLSDVLKHFGGSQHNLKCSVAHEMLSYSFSQTGDNKIYQSPIISDPTSGIKSAFVKIPIAYVYHDEKINPRALNSSVSKLVKEFYLKNPQLHVGLSRLEEVDGNTFVRVFDGQHKATAQLLLGADHLLTRLFLDVDIKRLTETNAHAGSTLRQIAFGQSTLRQLNSSILNERVIQYRQDHKLPDDDLSFSEQQLVTYYKGEKNFKTLIFDSIKNSITYDSANKLRDFVDFGGRATDLPLSYSTVDKVIYAKFCNSKFIFSQPLSAGTNTGTNHRELEISQIVRIMNIMAEEIYLGKFDTTIGTSKIEDKIIKGQAAKITDDHLVAYRMSKEEVIQSWIWYVQTIIIAYHNNQGIKFDADQMFHTQLDDQVFINIRNFIKNLRSLPLWKDRTMSATVFSGKKNTDYWDKVFKVGNDPSGVPVLATPINFMNMLT
jgi:hypothetical protein